MTSVAKLSYRIAEAVSATGVPRSTIYSEIKAGRLKTKKLGAIQLIMAEDLRDWLSKLEADHGG